MIKIILGIVLIFGGYLFADNGQNDYTSYYLEKYEMITGIFENQNDWRINMQLDRKFSKDVKQDIFDQKINYYMTDDKYLKISVKQLIRNVLMKEDYFYYTPQGKLMMAETESPNKEKYIFLYDDDNPIFYSKVKWSEGAYHYDELEFKQLIQGQEKDAIALLKNSVNFYNTTQEFLDNLPE